MKTKHQPIILNKFGLFLLILIHCQLCYSQITSFDSLKNENFSLNYKSNLSISYLASLVHPGVTIGYFYPISAKKIIKTTKPGITKTTYKSQFVGVNLSFYHHPKFHDNLFLTAEYSGSKTKTFHWTHRRSIGLGLSRTFLGGKAYRIDNATGVISKLKYPGLTYCVLTFSKGIAYNFKHKTKKAFQLHFDAAILTMFPYNDFIYARPVLKLGVTYTVGSKESFLKIVSKNKK